MGKIKFNQYTWSLYIKNEYCEGRGEQHSKKAKAKLISHVYWVLGNCFVFYQTNCNLCDNTHIRYILRTARTKGVVFTFCQTVCNPCDNTYSISLCICLGSWEEQRQRMWCRSPPGGEREREWMRPNCNLSPQVEVKRQTTARISLTEQISRGWSKRLLAVKTASKNAVKSGIFKKLEIVVYSVASGVRRAHLIENVPVL